MRRTKGQVAEEIVAAIEKDILDRRGLKWEWEAVDEEIKAEIRLVWIELIVKIV